MSAADDIGKSAVGGPAAVVTELARGFLTRAFRPSKKTVYKIDGQRVSGPEFRARVGVALPGQRPAPPGKMPPPQVAAPIAAPIAPVAPPTATRPADPGYRPDLTEPRLPPLKRPPTPARPPPPQGPTAADRPQMGPGGRPSGPLVSAATKGFMRLWLGRAGVTVSAAATIAYLLDLWSRTFPGQPLPDKPPPRRGGPGSQGGKGTQRPQLPPEIVFSPTINVNIPPQAPSSPKEAVSSSSQTPLPAPPTVATPMPAPTPRAPAPTPAPAPRPAPGATLGLPAWAQYAPALLPLLLSASSRKRKKRPAPGAGVIPGIPGLTPGIAPGLGLAPTEADFPLFSGGNYFDSTPSQRNCDCGPKKKRKPKKKRTVCYTGRFTERANGLRKYEKRKIKCR